MYSCIILCRKHVIQRKMNRTQQNKRHNDFLPSTKKRVAKEGLLGDANASSLSSVSVASVDILSCMRTSYIPLNHSFLH